jgi:hypothetical protein
MPVSFDTCLIIAYPFPKILTKCTFSFEERGKLDASIGSDEMSAGFIGV